MVVVAIVGVAFGLACLGITLLLAHRLYTWERQLSGARIGVAYRGRIVMDPTLFQLLDWALAVKRDNTRTGKMFYQNNKVSISVLEPRHKSHGKSKTTTIHSV